jgi:hypothetical protein
MTPVTTAESQCWRFEAMASIQDAIRTGKVAKPAALSGFSATFSIAEHLAKRLCNGKPFTPEIHS